MSDKRVIRHMILVSLVLLGLFGYAGLRVSMLRRADEGKAAAPKPDSPERSSADANKRLATDRRERPAPVPAPTAVPAPPLPLPGPDLVRAAAAGVPALPQAGEGEGGAAAAGIGGSPPATKVDPAPSAPPPATPLRPPPPIAPRRVSEQVSPPPRKRPPPPAAAKRAPSIVIEDEGDGEGFYTVRRGDTLSALARKFLGSVARSDAIYAANRDRLADPDHLRVGMRLRIPKRGATAPTGGRDPGRGAAAAAMPGTPSRPRVYTVRARDTLSSIARRFLGAASAWPRIRAANRDTIEDPDRLRIGMKVRIPAR